MKKLIAAVMLAAALGAAPPDPVSWKVEGAPAKPVKAGSRFTVKVIARIQEGWHMYSLTPVPDGPIPTRIWLPAGQPFQLAAAVKAQPPEIRNDPSFGMEVGVYERQAEFTVPVKVDAGASVGGVLAINASYQTCDNKICLPPKTVKLEAPVAVSK